MRRLFTLLGLFFLIFQGYRTSSQSTPQPWPMVRGNSKWNSLSTAVGPQSLNATAPTISDLPGRPLTSLSIDLNGSLYGYFSSNGQQGIYGLNPDGSVRTGWPFAGTTGSYAPTIGPDGTIFAVAGNNLVALNPDGSPKWPTSFNVGGGFANPTVNADGTIYISSTKLIAINPNGTEQWRFPSAPSDAITSDPVIGSDGTIYCLGGPNTGSTGGVTAINPNGTPRWTYTPPSAKILSSLIVSTDNTVYVLQSELPPIASTKIIRLNPATGSATEERSIPSTFWLDTRLSVTPNSTVVYTSCSPCGTKQIIGFVPDLSSERFNYSYPSNAFASLPAIGADGTIYVWLEAPTVSEPGKVIALAQDGSLKSESPLDYAYSIIPDGGSLSADGKLFFAALCCNSTGGKLIAFANSPAPVCTLTCPTNIAVQNTRDQCGAVVNYPSPTTTGCGTVSCNPNSGSFFAVGTTTVTCSASAGPSCSLTVTVQDTQPPKLSCPQNINATAPTEQNCVVITYPSPEASDNCSVASINCSPSSGTCFPLGSTIVTCTAADPSNNTHGCSFVVTVSAADLFGTIGIWDGQSLWPLDGRAISEKRITAKSRSTGDSITITVRSGGDYRFGVLPQGNYDLAVEIDYIDKVLFSSKVTCNLDTEGIDGGFLPKTTVTKMTNISVPKTERLDIKLPLPVVMVHGIRSGYNKWFSNDPKDKNRDKYWDNTARKSGFISFTPNYYWSVEGAITWPYVADQVSSQIEINLKGLTTLADSNLLPPWVYIGHSQGGLVARVLTSSSSPSSPLIDALQKIFILGTPNSGALRSYTDSLFCVNYLNEEPMQTQFNVYDYPDFGTKDVMAFAGDKNLSKTNDGAVSITSVRNIIQVRPGHPTVITELPCRVVHYNHLELGSKDSLELLDKESSDETKKGILQKVRALAP